MPGRLERIECGQPFGVFVDFAHTPDALADACKRCGKVTAGRLICVFGAGGERDRAETPVDGPRRRATADLAIVTNDNPRHEDPRRSSIDVLEGFFRRRTRPRSIPDRGEAIRHALAVARPGDCVLIAGKGHETIRSSATSGSLRRPRSRPRVALSPRVKRTVSG